MQINKYTLFLLPSFARCGRWRSLFLWWRKGEIFRGVGRAIINVMFNSCLRGVHYPTPPPTGRTPYLFCVRACLCVWMGKAT